uniref:EF-hand domain-containing protein n=1 Tax=Zooxanthella nutricula TaxID=1333877 RepID=A0A6U6HJU5_9DINO
MPFRAVVPTLAFRNKELRAREIREEADQSSHHERVSGRTSRTSASASEASQESSNPEQPATVRHRCRKALASPWTESMLAVAIGFNLCLITVETDRDAARLVPLQWVQVCNHLLLLLYSVEMAVRIYVFRSGFLQQLSDFVDFVLILMDVSMLILQATHAGGTDAPSFTFLRVVRLLRLARSIRVLQMFPQLALMVQGMFASIKLLAYGTCMLTLTLFLSGILAVHFVHPVNQRIAATGLYDTCDRCARAYESVPQAMLTFVQQLIAGDSWGSVSVPIIEEAPETAVFFVLVFVIVNLMVMNVILSMVVEVSLKAAAKDTRAVIEAQEKANVTFADDLKKICQDMDTDGSGCLSQDELVRGFDDNPQFREMMNRMKFRREDCPLVFNLLDTDESGDVNYNEFVEEVRKMHDKEADGALFLMKYHMAEVKVKIRESMQREFDALYEVLGYKIRNYGSTSVPTSPSRRGTFHFDASSICDSLAEIRRVLIDDISGDLKCLTGRAESAYPPDTATEVGKRTSQTLSAPGAGKRRQSAPCEHVDLANPAPVPEPRVPPKPSVADAAGHSDLVRLPPVVSGL